MAQDLRRLEFQAILEEILGSDEVWFQPPEDARTEMKYPCLVYELDNAHSNYADNAGYTWTPRYQVTFIRYEGDSIEVLRKLGALPLSSFSRHYVTSGLNHDVFAIYY